MKKDLIKLLTVRPPPKKTTHPGKKPRQQSMPARCSKIVVVAINQNAAITYQPFTISGATVAGFNRYRTTSSANLTADSFTIANGSFGINLPASSVTTLVSY